MFWLYRYKGFSRTAARTVHTAVVLAGQQGCSQADTGHLLLALVQTARGTAADFLRRKRVTATALAGCSAARSLGSPRQLHSRDLAPELTKAMEFAVLGAHAASAAKAENEHLLCAMLEDSSCTASRWMASLGIELPQAARECRQLSGQFVLPAQPRMSSSRTGRPSEKYGRDLTRLAQEGRLDPVLCREAELDRMIEILCRRQKNNPCLLGEPGVGKSALAEALAQRIASGQITPALRGKRLLALDMASMVAGTKYRGDFEERFKNLLEELYRDRSTVLFIDEIHIIAGAGAAEGAIDAASILKPMLARGEIQLIGATTPEEYRKTIQKDSALERRFGKVMVEEPAPADAEKILNGLMPRYERYHGVAIPPQAIHAAVELSVRYLPGRFLPDKAIDLLDEAAAARRIADTGGEKKALSPADIAHVVSKASGVPAERVGEAERERLAHLEERLSAEVIGQSRAVRRRPYSVVLFDEIEKAHSDIQNLLLQILEDGSLTDAQGRKSDFSNTIILLTSNLGARCLSGQTAPLGFGAATSETSRRSQQAVQEAKEFFRPELMGRLDETVLFDPLGPAQLEGIAGRLLCELEQRAAAQGYTLRHTAAAAKTLAGDKVPPYGARELRRTVSRAVEQALADRIAAGTAHPGVVYTADADAEGNIILTEGTLAACV